MEILTDISFPDLGLDLNHPARFPMKFKGRTDISGISDGDILVVDRSLDPVNDSVVVAEVKGEFVLRRFIQDKDETYLLRGEKKETEFEIWGVVHSSVHSLKR